MNPEINHDDDREDEDCVLTPLRIVDARRTEYPRRAGNEPSNLEDHVHGRRDEYQVIQSLRTSGKRFAEARVHLVEYDVEDGYEQTRRSCDDMPDGKKRLCGTIFEMD